MTDQELHQLRQRLKHRLIRTIDIVSILAMDTIALLIGYLFIRLVHLIAVGGGPTFEAAVTVSEMGFLLAYVALCGWDLWDFVRKG